MNRALSSFLSLVLVLLNVSPVLASFSDVSEFHPNKTAIEFLQQEGIISGSNGKFDPSRSVNRAEFLKMAILSSARVLDQDASLDFSDIDKTQWYYEFVNKAYHHGIVKGYDDKTFRPGQTVNKVEALKMLLKAHQIVTEQPSSSPFSDVPRTAWHAEFVAFAKENNLIDTSGATFSPQQEMTRAQLAEIIYRLIQLKNEGKVTLESVENDSSTTTTENQSLETDQEVMTTNGVRHSIPLEAITDGGVPKDWVPSIDSPIFEMATTADGWLDDYDRGIGISIDGVDRFYPYAILNWHSIVNDTISGADILVTYDPLTYSGLVYERTIGGESMTFGTSGKLWNSNLLMYDRKTGSYWSQLLGKAIKGELTGTSLVKMKTDNVLWKEWKAKHPNSNVLSRQTGRDYDYSTSPYGDYEDNDTIYFALDNTDTRFSPKERMYGVEVNGVRKAYFLDELDRSPGTFNDLIGGIPVTLSYDFGNRTLSAVRQFTDETFIPVSCYWFAWYAVFPDTEVYDSKETP